MKKSKTISLVLVTSLLGCGHPQPQNRLYLRTDSSGYYTRGTPGFYGFYVFRPYGMYYGGSYMRQGYANGGVHSSEANVTRGGFGGSEGFHVSS